MPTRTALFRPGLVPELIAPVSRRKITPQAGKAIEMLAHALEYLSDECRDSELADPFWRARIAAVELLMALNRDIYMECPAMPTAGARCRELLRRCFDPGERRI